MVFFKGHTANIYCGHVISFADEMIACSDKDDILVVSSPTRRDLEWLYRVSCTDFVLVCPD